LNGVTSIGGDQESAATCNVDLDKPLILSEDQQNTVRYTYRVTWNVRFLGFLNLSLLTTTNYSRNRILHGYVCRIPTSVHTHFHLKATRWDNYLHIFDPRIHWFSLVNSLVIVIFLCVMVSMILLRSVSRDVSLAIPKARNYLTRSRFLDTMPSI
jgi:transmembrane 9 superfamily protein 2/4